MAKDRPKDTAGFLGDWRAAERDAAAAKTAQTVAEMALVAARAAEEAAMETEIAARAAVEASKSAQRAAQRAKQAATHAAEAASILTSGAEDDKARANHEVGKAEAAETDARDRFHEAEQMARDKNRS